MDQYSLTRFLDAQKTVYQQALSEITSGRKQSHWMWFIFPQYHGLGSILLQVNYALHLHQDEGQARIVWATVPVFVFREHAQVPWQPPDAERGAAAA